MPGVAEDFEKHLQAASRHQRQNDGSLDQANALAARFRFMPTMLSSVLGFFSEKLQHTQQELLSFELHSVPTEQITSSHQPSFQTLFLLICMNDSIGDSVVKLQQLSVHDIDSDQRLFRALGKMYMTLRHRWWSFLSLWSLNQINFMHFHLYEKFLVDVKDWHVVPPEDECHCCLYERINLKPPIGSNLLMHYIRCPQDSTILSPCLEKVPKKLGGKLQVCPTEGVSAGWWLQFIEGWNWKKILLRSFVTFTASAATIAAICRQLGRSVQNAFAISSFMLACFVLSVGALQAWLNMV